MTAKTFLPTAKFFGLPNIGAKPGISLAAFGFLALCGVIFIMNKDDISGGFKLLLSVVFGISFIAFAASIVNSVFSFSGAVI